MKRIFGLMVLVSVLMVPALSFAADKQTGIYVAPKFVYGLAQTEGGKAQIFDSAGSVGRVSIGSNTDDTFGGAIAFGYDFSKQYNVPVRAEIEYSIFSEAEADKRWSAAGTTLKLTQTFQVQTLFLNAYWDIDTGTKLTPYIGAGLGMGFIDTKGKAHLTDGTDSYSDSTGSKTVTNFAWNVGVGLGYDINDNWTIDAGYRFVGLGSVKTKNRYDAASDFGMYGKTDNLYQHQFGLGIRYTF